MILETTDGEVDMDGLVDLLDRVVETTDGDRRFCWGDVDPFHLFGAFFLEELEVNAVESYFPTTLSFLGD